MAWWAFEPYDRYRLYLVYEQPAYGNLYLRTDCHKPIILKIQDKYVGS